MLPEHSGYSSHNFTRIGQRSNSHDGVGSLSMRGPEPLPARSMAHTFAILMEGFLCCCCGFWFW